MANTVNVSLSGVSSQWTSAFRIAVRDLNSLLRSGNVDVQLQIGGSQGTPMRVRANASLTGMHGHTSTHSRSSRVVRAEVQVPQTVEINTPRGPRQAGPPIYIVIAAHEIVHGLGHNGHTSLLMASTFETVLGNRPAGDRLKTGSTRLPPVRLASQSLTRIRPYWT